MLMVGATKSADSALLDLSLESNVPILLMPARFAERIAELPPPSRDSLSSRKLAVWFASNCCGATWDRAGYVVALGAALGSDLTLGGLCANMVSELAAMQQQQGSNGEASATAPPKIDASAFARRASSERFCRCSSA